MIDNGGCVSDQLAEYSENGKYKDQIESMLKEGDSFCPFRKEQQMNHLLELMQNDFRERNLKIIDVCSGYGRLIHYLNEHNNRHNYLGVDYVEELVAEGRERFKHSSNISFQNCNAFELSKMFSKEFDVAINYKTLSWLPYYENILKEIVKITKSKIYITSLFYDGDIDFITKIYQKASNGDRNQFSYLNTYSLPKFTKYCELLGVKDIEVLPMHIGIDLERPEKQDELKTYTLGLSNSESRLEVTGTVILNWKLISLTLN